MDHPDPTPEEIDLVSNRTLSIKGIEGVYAVNLIGLGSAIYVRMPLTRKKQKEEKETSSYVTERRKKR